MATLRSVFADVCVLADPDVLRGRKAGNAVLVAGADLGDLPARAGALRGCGAECIQQRREGAPR